MTVCGPPEDGAIVEVEDDEVVLVVKVVVVSGEAEVVIVVGLVLSLLSTRYFDDGVPVDFLLTCSSISFLSTVNIVLR